ncbi:transcription factor VIP1 [Mercurialis annua]|uniref:transcription factor VIP1 n=1 Tax=Mercurialis annua TaxID=3986 RepID=UPI002160DAE8|nr:transcription factor VIP1 [Mercurialis annua]
MDPSRQPMMMAMNMNSNYMDIEQMPDTPQRGSHHRRAHSDTSFRFDDLLLFDPSDLDLSALDLPTPTPSPGGGGGRVAPVPVDSGSVSDDSAASHSQSQSSGASLKPRPINHLRSLSVDSDFFDGLGLTSNGGGDEKFGGKRAAAAVATPSAVNRHRHSLSMDGSSTSLFEVDSVMGDDGVKKAMAPEKLAELALIDPRRAKRILANRQSAARSKERKVRYTGELERKVQTLQTEATTLSAQVTLLQRDTTGLSTENKELKLRLQAMEQQAHLRDALNEALREEVQRLKIATGQIPAANGNPFSRGLTPQYSSHQAPLHHFGSSQAQQHQQPQHIPQPSTNNQTPNGQSCPGFANFSQRV